MQKWEEDVLVYWLIRDKMIEIINKISYKDYTFEISPPQGFETKTFYILSINNLIMKTHIVIDLTNFSKEKILKMVLNSLHEIEINEVNKSFKYDNKIIFSKKD